jgi:hypothetical protein
MTRHGPLCSMTAISTPRSTGSLVPGPTNIAPVTQCSTAMGRVDRSFVSKTLDYATLGSLGSAAPSTTKTNRNPLSP